MMFKYLRLFTFFATTTPVWITEVVSSWKLRYLNKSSNLSLLPDLWRVFCHSILRNGFSIPYKVVKVSAGAASCEHLQNYLTFYRWIGSNLHFNNILSRKHCSGLIPCCNFGCHSLLEPEKWRPASGHRPKGLGMPADPGDSSVSLSLIYPNTLKYLFFASIPVYWQFTISLSALTYTILVYVIESGSSKSYTFALIVMWHNSITSIISTDCSVLTIREFISFW